MKVIKHPNLFGLILAGGRSRRMGRDKALLEFHGVPQVEFIAKILEKHCAQVFLSKRSEQQAYEGLRSINDAPEFDGQGPLGGILSAMKSYPDLNWLVVACDLPFVVDETIQSLLEQRDPQKTATCFISSHDALPEPLCAIWEAHAYQGLLKLFNEGIHCPRKALINSDTHLLQPQNVRWLENINTPEELNLIKNIKK